MNGPYSKEDVKEFLGDLTDLCDKYGIYIEGFFNLEHYQGFAGEGMTLESDVEYWNGKYQSFSEEKKDG